MKFKIYIILMIFMFLINCGSAYDNKLVKIRIWDDNTSAIDDLNKSIEKMISKIVKLNKNIREIKDKYIRKPIDYSFSSADSDLFFSQASYNSINVEGIVKEFKKGEYIKILDIKVKSKGIYTKLESTTTYSLRGKNYSINIINNIKIEK